MGGESNTLVSSTARARYQSVNANGDPAAAGVDDLPALLRWEQADEMARKTSKNGDLGGPYD